MKKSFYQFANSKGTYISPEDALFVHLAVVIGMPLAQSYQFAYKDICKANLSSCAALASRKIRDVWIKRYITEINKHYLGKPIELKELGL